MLLFSRQSEVIEAHDPRVAEILELVAVEGIRLRISIDVILWLEDRGYVVDLRTGIAMKVEIARVTPTGNAINHLLATPTEREIEQTIDGLFAPACTEDAYAIGEMDHDDGKPCEPLNHFDDLAAIDSYIIGYKAAQAPDGELQAYIDAGHEIDARHEDPRFDGCIEDDHDWIRGGC